VFNLISLRPRDHLLTRRALSVLAWPAFALLASCAGRPCACELAAARARATPAPCSASTSAASSERPAPFAAKPTLIWDGEDPNAKAKGWASCEEKELCAASLNAKAGAGRDGSTGLEFVVKGKKWAGFGWNWFGWWPDTAGTDISAYKSVRFWLKVSAAAGKKKPPADTLRLSLHGSSKGGKDTTASVTVGDYSKSFLDGEWHEIVVPLEPLLRGEGETFDSEKTWEIDFGAWTMEECEYTLSLDEIAFL
jgi:hypothetical protein